jgi:hypothetical protein
MCLKNIKQIREQIKRSGSKDEEAHLRSTLQSEVAWLASINKEQIDAETNSSFRPSSLGEIQEEDETEEDEADEENQL